MKLSIRQYSMLHDYKHRTIRRPFRFGPISFGMGQNGTSKGLEKPYRHADFHLRFKVGRLSIWVNNETGWGAYWSFPFGWVFSVTTRSCYGHYEHCDIRGHYIPRLEQWDRDGDRMLHSISIYGIN